MKRRLLEMAADLIFPRRCPFCREVTGGGICDECAVWAEKIRRADPAVSLSAEHDAIDFAAAVYWYDEPVRSAILRMKDAEDRQTARTLSDCLRKVLLTRSEFRCAEAVVPVPASAQEFKSRGYTVPMWLSEFTVRDTGIPVCSDTLLKVRETKRQASLSGQERRKNLRKAFSVPESRRENLPDAVVLIDDVFTTGSTLNECARALKCAGVEYCCALTLAVTK